MMKSPLHQRFHEEVTMSNIDIAKSLGFRHNLSFRVYDRATNRLVREYKGHNQGTNSLLTGIGHYLLGDGVLNQGYAMLSRFVPQYISLGTMGLINQDTDEYGLPAGIGVSDTKRPSETDEEYEIRRYQEYMNQMPGYGADGYDRNQNNGRYYLGLGPKYADKVQTTGNADAVKCELISTTFPRTKIVHRDIISEIESELPQTIDVVYSAMISTGALAQFRGENNYIFITEAGLWSDAMWTEKGSGLLAGYRLAPPNEANWDMTVAENRQLLRENIIRVDVNQVVQVIWKIQIGSIADIDPFTIALDESSLELTVGDTAQLTATVHPIGTPITWSSSNENVVTVNYFGGIRAAGEGEATIKATITSPTGTPVTATCSVTVTAPI